MHPATRGPAPPELYRQVNVVNILDDQQHGEYAFASASTPTSSISCRGIDSVTLHTFAVTT